LLQLPEPPTSDTTPPVSATALTSAAASNVNAASGQIEPMR
jgi:hypothetical protein